MQRILRLFCLPIWCMLVLVGCNESQTKKLKIVCSTDVHGNFFPYDFCSDSSSTGSLARVSSYLNGEREVYGDNLLFIDAGDILQGQPTSYYYNTQAIEEPHLAAEVLNYLKCDAATLGNHDIEPGGATYQRYIGDCHFPVVCGNIYFEDSETPFLPPYTIKECDGVKVAILGLITPAVPNWLPRNLWRGLEFIDMELAARRWMDYLHRYEQPDVVVGLFHSGYEGGIVTDSYAENAARSVAEQVPGFDVVFYGHDHTERNTQVVNVVGDTVLLLNPANNANSVATVEITYSKQGNDKVQLALSPAIVNVDDLEPDARFLEKFSSQMEKVKAYVSRRVGTFTQAMDARKAYWGPSEYVDFIHRMQLDITSAQISFAAPLSYDALIPAGDIHVRDLFKIYRYENQLYLMRLSGREIRDYLEMSYSLWINGMSSSEDPLLLFSDVRTSKPTLKNAYYNFDSAAGIIYDVDVTKPSGQRVIIKSLADGKPFELDKIYYVAVNSYRGNGGGELLTKGAGIPKEELEGRIEYATDADLRFYLYHYIEGRGMVTPQSLGQWRFVPEGWVKQAALRDSQRLFGRF